MAGSRASELKKGEEGPPGGSGLVLDGYRSPSMGAGRKGETDRIIKYKEAVGAGFLTEERKLHIGKYKT